MAFRALATEEKSDLTRKKAYPTAASANAGEWDVIRMSLQVAAGRHGREAHVRDESAERAGGWGR